MSDFTIVEGDVTLRKSDGTELGTATDPVRTDPTGTTAQPVTDNGGSLTVDATSWPLPTGAATEATLGTLATEATLSALNTNAADIETILTAIRDTAGIKKITDALPAGDNNIGNVDVVSSALPTGAATEATLATRAADRTTADAPHATRLSDGTSFYKATTPADIQPVAVRDGQHNQSAQYSVFGLQKVAQDATLADLRYDDDSLTSKWTVTISNGAGYQPEPGGVGIKLVVAPTVGSKIELKSKQTFRYESGRGMLMKISTILGDTGVAGNVREWGMKNDKGDGLFMRMDGTSLKFIHRNQGVETEHLASAFDTPVSVDANGHLWYVQFPWLGVADIFVYHDNEVVHRAPQIGLSTDLTLGDPDMYVFMSNENVSNNTLVYLKSGCASVFVEGGTTTSGRTDTGESRTLRVDDRGQLLLRLVDGVGNALALEDAPGGAALRTFDGEVLAVLQQVLRELRMIRMQLGHATELRFNNE